MEAGTLTLEQAFTVMLRTACAEAGVTLGTSAADAYHGVIHAGRC
jgi:hypothetical protein